MFDNPKLSALAQSYLGIEGPEGLSALMQALRQAAQSDPRLQQLSTQLPVFLQQITVDTDRSSGLSNRQLLNAIDALDTGFALFDPNDRLISCSPRLRKMYPAVAHILVLGAPYRVVMRAIYRGFGVNRDLPLVTNRPLAPPEEFAFGDRWICVRESRAADGCTISIHDDITASKRVTLGLVEAKETAESASRTKSEFLANMSHEIRTPMNGIIGMTALALETPLNAEQRDYLETVKSSADALLVVINDILDFSKIEAGKLDIESISFSLSNVLNECLKPMAVRAHDKNLELLCRIAPQIPTRVHGDPGRLRQIITNLVGNAIKFTHKGQISIEVGIEHHGRHDLMLHFSVSDTGIGIPQNKQKLIFDAFAQADASTTREYGGTGLGLAICARLVRLMGGDISVSSQPDQGSCFRFTLPIAASTPKHGEPLDDMHLDGRKVLLVEDHPTNLAWLEDMVSSWGMKVTTATSGTEALKRLCDDDKPFDFVLLDADMPGVSGFDVAEALQDRPDVLSKTTMLLATSKLSADIARCRSLGLAGHVNKPVSQSELFDAIMLTTAPPSNFAEPALEHDTTPEGRPSLQVLLAEDNAINQKLAIRLLETLGHRVTVVNNGIQAIELSADDRFDLILMDMQMPVMGGMEATQVIRQREASGAHHQIIVAMTANAMQGDRERCLEAGMDGYVSKPIDKAKLIQEIDRVMVRAQSRQIWLSTSMTLPPELEVPAVDPSLPDLDMAQAMERWDGNQTLYMEVAMDFMTDCPRQVKAIQRAIYEVDGKVLFEEAHALAGAAGSLSALAIERLSRQLMEAASDKDFFLASTLVDQLDARVRSFELALKQQPQP